MRIQQWANSFIVARGRAKESFFCFYVDADRSCWSQRHSQAQQYSTRQAAQNAIGELKRRAHMRKAARLTGEKS